MSDGVVKKCTYFNYGCCRYTRKEKVCNNFHLKDASLKINVGFSLGVHLTISKSCLHLFEEIAVLNVEIGILKRRKQLW